jgi:2-C-methyl-D-erythritol 4-phosphate cytidylyltransferase
VPDRPVAIIPVRPASLVSSLSILGRPVLNQTLRALRSVPEVGLLVLALERVTADECLSLIPPPKQLGVAVTATFPDRWQALRAAVELGAGADLVLLHEPNRPLTSPSRLRDLLQLASGREAVVATVPVRSSVKRVHDQKVAATVPRESLHLLRGPWLFSRESLLRALDQGLRQSPPPRDELELLSRSRIPVHSAEGYRFDVGVASPADVRFAELALKWRGSMAVPASHLVP